MAKAVAALIGKPRRRVTVTRAAGVVAAFNKLTPRPIGEYFIRKLGVHRAFTDDVDREARRGYDNRLRRP